MNEELMDLIKLQGEMRVALLMAGVSEKQSEETACTILDLVANSTCVKPEVKNAYVQHLAEE